MLAIVVCACGPTVLFEATSQVGTEPSANQVIQVLLGMLDRQHVMVFYHVAQYCEADLGPEVLRSDVRPCFPFLEPSLPENNNWLIEDQDAPHPTDHRLPLLPLLACLGEAFRKALVPTSALEFKLKILSGYCRKKCWQDVHGFVGTTFLNVNLEFDGLGWVDRPWKDILDEIGHLICLQCESIPHVERVKLFTNLARDLCEAAESTCFATDSPAVSHSD